MSKIIGFPVEQISNLMIWGNHSNKIYPDTFHCRIQN